MYSITVSNVNNALSEGLRLLLRVGEREESRNGTVVVAPCPVTTTYLNPAQRVLFSPMRDANPWFHLMESLWMLAGRNDLAWPMQFNSRFGEYSDNGSSVWGAYGYRWLRWFGIDQLTAIVEELRRNPNSRRCVLAMWDGAQDLDVACGVRRVEGEVYHGTPGKDVPCNTHAYLDTRHGVLNMTVCCRSNDILWGAYGANAVHFSVLLEFLAAWLHVPVGVYRQISNNYHAYTDVIPLGKFEDLAVDAAVNDAYDRKIHPLVLVPLVNESAECFLSELQMFLADPLRRYDYQEKFLRSVAQPMYAAWTARKQGTGTGHLEASYIEAQDWYRACTEWLDRRKTRKAAKVNG